MNLLNNYSNFLNFYDKPLQGTGYLAFRDLKPIISSFGEFRTALDFGCGRGRSSFYLEALGLELTGVDLNKDMISNAIPTDNISYFLIGEDKLPFRDESFDVVFNSFVLCEISSEHKLVKTFKELKLCVIKMD